jgi:hypothetical protein
MTRTARIRNGVSAAGFLFLGCALAAPAFAADVTGHWAGTVKPGNGRELPFAADFQQQGAVVTGKLAGINGGPDVPISNGKNTNDTITWTATPQVRTVPITFNDTGTRAGDAMDVQIVRVDGQGAPQSAHIEKTH